MISSRSACAFWPLALARRARRPDPAPAHQRGGDRPLDRPHRGDGRRSWRPTTASSPRTPRTGWCARSASTSSACSSGSTSRRGRSSRSSSRARASPGPCWSWSSPPTAPTCSTARARATPARRPRVRLTELNFGAYPMINGLTRLASRFLGRARRASTKLRGLDRPGPRRRGGQRGRAGDLHARRHRLGRRGPPGHRGARRLLARRAHGHGGLPALRRPRDPGDEDLRTSLRVAELDLPAPERRGAQGRAPGVRQRPARRSSIEGECDGDGRLSGADPQQRRPQGQSPAPARARGVAAEVPRLVDGDGPRGLPDHATSTCAPPSAWTRTAGPTSTT